MRTEDEWERLIEARERKIREAFLEYARDSELPAINTSYFFARQILPDEPIVLKHCIIMCLIESGSMKIVEEKWTLRTEV